MVDRTLALRLTPSKAALLIGTGACVALYVPISQIGGDKASLFVIGVALGLTLYHGAFGFTDAYRRAFVEADGSGITAQVVMLSLAVLLFAPLMHSGQFQGETVVGAVAPASLSVAIGAFMFGIGMQLGGACASGSLYSAGGGNIRILVVLAFFCLGGFWASLHYASWSTLPGIGAISLIERIGPLAAILLQLAVLGGLLIALRGLGLKNRRPLWWTAPITAVQLVRGPWPLLFAAALLAVLNFAILLIAGHPWSITWGFTLWAAKLAAAAGWEPGSTLFWADGYQRWALDRPIFADNTSVTNVGIILGALVASALAGRFRMSLRVPLLSLATAIGGGLLMGYGARLAYGCNIGAFFSGVASSSLHGWLWILAAIPGNYVGWRLRDALARFDKA